MGFYGLSWALQGIQFPHGGLGWLLVGLLALFVLSGVYHVLKVRASNRFWGCFISSTHQSILGLLQTANWQPLINILDEIIFFGYSKSDILVLEFAAMHCDNQSINYILYHIHGNKMCKLATLDNIFIYMICRIVTQ